jgi:hypothetical protein
MEELVKIVTKFIESGWDVIDTPSKEWLSAINKIRITASCGIGE